MMPVDRHSLPGPTDRRLEHREVIDWHDHAEHQLVSQTVRDCLEEAMDFAGLSGVLTRIHAGGLRLVTRDTPEPSPLAHEILNARPYAFLDDAPLEERRTQAVYARRTSDPSSAKDIGALDAQAIERVRDEARPDPRDPDELHDALVTAGFLTVEEARAIPPGYFEALTRAGRATRVLSMWVAAERLPEMCAVHPEATLEPVIAAPPGRAARTWARDEAIVELLRGRVSIDGPTDIASLARLLSVSETDAHGALVDLEGQGVVLRGHFTGQPHLEFCDRSLLARIHRYTLNRLRAEIEPVSVADFTRFLFAWQHADAASQLTGAEGLRAIVARLDGFELPARAWEHAVLPARLERYDASMLDMLCLAGQACWSRLSAPSAEGSSSRSLRVALYLRDHAAAWQALRFPDAAAQEAVEASLDETSRKILTKLRSSGASFLRDLASAAGVDADALTAAIATLAARGLVTADGFAGVRALVRAMKPQPVPFDHKRDLTGRWSALQTAPEITHDAAVDVQARVLLERYGVMFRRLLTRETNAPSWRELTRVYRRLEARGEIRGGRFVTGVSGEQFALPEAVERLREVRRSAPAGRLVTISAADPLNLTGILAGDDRVRALTSTRIVYRDGVALAVLEGDYLRPLGPVEPALSADVASAAAGRRMPAVSSGFVGR